MGPQVEVRHSQSGNAGKEADVVIIGGGIIGTSAALYLAKRGLKVVLCEKGHIAGEQSSRNWGWVRKARRDPREIPLIVESLRLWERMNETIGEETGFRTTGTAFAVESDADVARYRDLARTRPSRIQIDARIISGSRVRARMCRAAAGAGRAALFCATDGRAEPQKAAPAIARAAQRAGRRDPDRLRGARTGSRGRRQSGGGGDRARAHPYHDGRTLPAAPGRAAFLRRIST